MSRRAAQAILIPLAALLTCATQAGGQRSPDPFAAAALMAGPQRFVRPPVTDVMLGGYFYFPHDRLLLGGQGGAVIPDGVDSRVVYGLATVGVTTFRGTAWQTYPFLAAGAGVLRARGGPDTGRLLFGAGLGVDRMIDRRGLFIAGARVGYITRSMARDASIAYVALSLGMGLRSEPPDQVAAR